MPPRLPPLRSALTNFIARPLARRTPLQLCPFCAFAPRRQHHPNTSNSSSRDELRTSLVGLQKYATNFVNTSRLQLALRGLDQTPGEETVRIAILGLADGGRSLTTARKLLRLMLADPLKPEEEWERTLLKDQEGPTPLLLRVGYNAEEEGSSAGRLVHELNVSSPMVQGHKLEILVLEMDPPLDHGAVDFMEAVLVPTMEIPTSSSGRYTPVTTPVHRSLVVGEGIMGVASLLGYPVDTDRSIIGTVANLRLGDDQERKSLPFPVVDIAQGTAALESFRESVDNALLYEQNWFASGIPDVMEWAKNGTLSKENETKPSVRKLIESVIASSADLVASAESNRLSAALSAKVPAQDLISLREKLSAWGEAAHTELRDELDIAFEGQRWRKLGWWKLFWRVDDVSMITTDILNQRFLTNSEKDVIFLAGQIEQAGVLTQVPRSDWAYKPIEVVKNEAKVGDQPLPPKIQDLVENKDIAPVKVVSKPWPLHIPVTRAYLSHETVPALQALAQKLVLQTITTSSFASIFAGLIYVSTFSTGVYEVGAVAALGVVWSLRRLQGRWETARKFWEGEVREEGRKAVRSVEDVVGRVLTTETPVEVDTELEKAKEMIERAKAALAQCK